MLSYQHIYHAGNFADVQKHAVLAALVRQLATKPQPFAVLDTHAGRGLYDLSSDAALKTGEFAKGIAAFWAERGRKTPLADYLALVAGFNEGDTLKNYPGSGKVVQKLLRAGDKLTLIERHPGEFEELKKNFPAGTTLLHEDGFKYLEEKLPLSERRGLVLVDPSYEIKTEYTDLPQQLKKALKKWPQGQYMIWYPLLPAGGHAQMLTALRKTDIKDMLVSEIRIADQPGMYGTGVIIINPPVGFEHTLETITQHIAQRLPETSGEVFWLNNRPIDPETGLIKEPVG